MPLEPLNTGFLRKQPGADKLYSFPAEDRYKNFYVKQFKGDKEEFAAIGKYFYDQLSHFGIILEMALLLRNNFIPEDRKLFGYAHKLLKVFFSYADNEPLSAGYYNKFLGILKPFLLIISTYQEKIQQNLFNMITSHLIDTVKEENAGVICSEDLEDLQTVIGQYADSVKRYIDEFNGMLREGSDKFFSFNDQSQVVEYLSKLVLMTEKSALNAESMMTRLGKWKMEVMNIEIRETYN